MLLLNQDFKKGIVKLKITDQEDFWYLSHLLDPGDSVTGTASRKIKIGAGEEGSLTRKTFTVTLEVVEVSLGSGEQSLRINGKVLHAPEYVPLGSYQALELEVGSEFVVEKPHWLSYQRQRLQEATQLKHKYLLCVFDREEALFALSKTFGFEVLLHLHGEAAKKRMPSEVRKDFFQDIIAALEEYRLRYKPEKIILASPAFYKEVLLQKITSPELKKSVALASCSDVSEQAFREVLTRPELQQVLQESRLRQESLLLEELFTEIKRNGLAVYGWEEVRSVAEAGAISMLLVTDNFIHQQRGAGNYLLLDELLRGIDKLQGKIHIFSSQQESGRRLDGLGGIAALLRYRQF